MGNHLYLTNDYYCEEHAANTTNATAYNGWYDAVYMPVAANANLASLTIGNVGLNPSFAPSTTEYTATTSNATNTITATAAAAGATVGITVNGTATQSGSSVTWNTGDNTVVVKLSIGLVNDMYTESANDDYKYARVATQEEMDLF